MKRKKSKLSIVIIIILLFLVSALLVYIFNNDKEKIKNNKEKYEKETTTKIEDDKKEEFSIDEASKIMENLNKDWKYTLATYDVEIFNNDGYKTYLSILKSKINNDLIYNNYDVKNSMERDAKFIKINDKQLFDFNGYEYSEVESTFKTLFTSGEVVTDVSLIKGAYCLDINYDSKLKLYITSTDGGCGDGMILLSDIYEAYKVDNELYINVVNAKINSDSSKDYLELSDSNEEINIASTNEKELMEKYKDKMNKYQFIFDIENDSYRFNKVEKIDE